ncbi:MAG: hypothetical protein LH650_01455, partial [Chloroflexi bacterium]|nr:hypothetical protein [Chloroflexota bacterium]
MHPAQRCVALDLPSGLP